VLLLILKKRITVARISTISY